MKIIKLKLKDHPYDIIIGNRIMSVIARYIRRLGLGTDAYVITNPAIKNAHGAILKNALLRAKLRVRFKNIAASEKSKSIGAASEIIRDIAGFAQGKRVFIIAFGGGVIGDLAGFVASIYKRGIPYIQIPTTLLAQVDSAIGGKTAVDLPFAKNLAGAFYQPRLVLSDVRMLRTLTLRQLRNGLAETIKYGIIKDPQLFRYLESNYKKILARNLSALEYIVIRCSRIKAGIVAQDEKEEKGIRTILNFGHTLGHAVEAAAGWRYNHGEAIALGMLAATDLSCKLKLSDNATWQRIKDVIKAVGLPSRIENVPLSGIIKAHYHDKKFIGGKNRFVLIERIGRTKLVEDIPLELIRDALKRLNLPPG